MHGCGVLAIVALVAACGGGEQSSERSATRAGDDEVRTVPARETDLPRSAPTTTAVAVPRTVASTLPSSTSTTGASHATTCPAGDGSSPAQQDFDAPPPMCIDVGHRYSAVVVTNDGAFTIELDPAQAPITVNNFVVLARYHYYDDTVCHRIITDFVIQCGDPTGTGAGGPGYEFEDERPASADQYVLGSVSMANAGAGTNGSQFFIAGSAQTADALEPLYSLFGQVSDGLDTTISTLNQIGSDDPNGTPPRSEVRIESVTIVET
jgi:cyclophilin family peptidyl-prolyl cis-trans isomerase